MLSQTNIAKVVSSFDVWYGCINPERTPRAKKIAKNSPEFTTKRLPECTFVGHEVDACEGDTIRKDCQISVRIILSMLDELVNLLTRCKNNQKPAIVP